MRLNECLKACLLAVVMATAAGTAAANEATPFLEGEKKVGGIETAHARVLHAGGDVYVVVVHSDTDECYAIPAKAKAGVVKAEQLGKGVTVKARITSYTKRPDLHPAVELEILSVK